MRTYKEFQVNAYLSLVLIDGNTEIYVNDKPFDQCKFLLINIPVDKISSFDEIDSIDEASERLDDSLEPTEDFERIQEYEIPSEVEFWAHCSNLQVWAENEYDTRLLHRNLAFPLLKALTEAGAPVAKKVFKDEIAKRLASGFPSVVNYLIEQHYHRFLTHEELSQVLEQILCETDWRVLKELEELTGEEFDLSSQFRPESKLNIIIDGKHIVGLKIKELISFLPDYIGNLSNLKILDVSVNELEILPESIGNLKNLEKMRLSANKLKTLPESIGNLESLKELDLNMNNLEDLPQSVENLKFLERLNLSYNNFKQIPAYLFNITSLTRSLSLRNNFLKLIPNSLGNLKSLKVLSLSNNQLKHLPYCIRELQNLEILFLDHNSLEKIPYSLGNLQNLKELYLDETQKRIMPNILKKKKDLKIWS